MLPRGDPIHRISAPVCGPRPEAEVAWLRVELKSGRRFEIAPVESYVEGERYPRLAIEIGEVQDFAKPAAWPGGPELTWFTPAKVAATASLSIEQDEFTGSTNGVAPAGYEAALSSGQTLRIWHSQESPMTLKFEIEPHASNVA